MGPGYGGIGRLGRTLTQYWRETEADFTRYYHADLTQALEEWHLGKVLGHVKNLPYDAALWLAQERDNPSQPVETDTEERTYASKGEEVRAFFTEHFGSDSAQ